MLYGGEPVKTPQTQSGLLTDKEFSRELAERLAQAHDEGLGFAVVACVPQHLPGEGVAEVVEVAAGCLRTLMRDDDLAGLLDGEGLAVVLGSADATAARVFAHRLPGELRLR